MAKQMRRLANEHAALMNDPPTDYIILPSDDLTSLDTYLIGPTSTPYEQGIWRLHLKMTDTYPREPPKASFRTKIFHPNVEERSGEVCVDTLKTGWKSETTLRDVLSTIRCLLIHPNPSSALNADAGMLADEDYKAFTRQARLMTKIHAPVPPSLKAAVKDSRQKALEEEERDRSSSPTATTSTTHNILHTPTKDTFTNPSTSIRCISPTDTDTERPGKENHSSGCSPRIPSPSSKKRSSDEMDRNEVAALMESEPFNKVAKVAGVKLVTRSQAAEEDASKKKKVPVVKPVKKAVGAKKGLKRL